LGFFKKKTVFLILDHSLLVPWMVHFGGVEYC